MLAVMTGIEVFANLVAAYDGDPRQKSSKAFGSLLIIMGTTALTMLIVGPAIFTLSDPTNLEVSVFTQTMDTLLPQPLPYIGTLVGIAVLLSASAASAQGLQNLALGLEKRNYIPAFLGQRNKFDVADKPVWLEVGLVAVIFLVAGTNEETYLAIYAAGVFVLLSMTGWAATKRLVRFLGEQFSASNLATLIGTAIAATITTAATVVIFRERFFEGAWIYFVLIPLLYLGFSYSRSRLGAPSPVEESLGELEGAMLGGFGFGQSFEPAAGGLSGAGRVLSNPQPAEDTKPIPLSGWQDQITPPQHILVPLDGSDFAEQALPSAEALCLAYDARLLLLSVPQARKLIRALPIYARLPKPGTDEWNQQEAYLSEVAGRLQALGIKADTVVRTGMVTDAINDLVQERGVDMVVLSTRGRSGLPRMVLGSVATQVIQGVTRPVMLIKPIEGATPPIPEYKKLLVTLDGSEFAERVLPYVRASARFESVVLLLTVPQVPEPEKYGAVVEKIQQLREQAEREAREYLDCVAAKLREDGIETRVLVCGSRPAETIISVADEEDVDVVFLATHGRGGLDRLFVGSVADRIIHNTHCPVFLVPIHERRSSG